MRTDSVLRTHTQLSIEKINKMGKSFTDKELKSDSYKYSLFKSETTSTSRSSIMIIFNIPELLC